MKTRTRILATLCLLFLLTACGTPTEDGTGLLFKTANPKLTIGFRLLPAPPIPAIEPQVVPAEEVGEALPDPTPVPPCLIVKGNIGRTGKIAHAPGDPNYNQVKIDESAGERFFCSMEEAVAAGWRPVR